MALDKAGGLDALGGQKFDNMYHAGWAWAGDTPFHHTKPVASHFGSTRNSDNVDLSPVVFIGGASTGGFAFGCCGNK